MTAWAARTNAEATAIEAPEELESVRSEWNALAVRAGSPFLTLEWLGSLWEAFGRGRPRCLVLRAGDGTLRAGGWWEQTRRAGLAALANDHSGGWDVVAADAEARAALWSHVASLAARRLDLPEMDDDPSRSGIAAAALRAAGYRVIEERGPLTPFLNLPPTWDDLIRSVSRNLRGQLGRRRRALERDAALTFRTTSGGSALVADLEAVLRVEGSGWKGRAGTAILSDRRTARLYRRFARAAADQGWLRLHLLESDGEPIAVDYACAFAGGEFLLKTGYDERLSRWSPGLVLRAEVLRRAIEDGLAFYDFLGSPDPYKLRWGSELRPRVRLRAYRGALAFPPYAYRRRIRPALKTARDRALRRRIGPVADGDP